MSTTRIDSYRVVSSARNATACALGREPPPTRTFAHGPSLGRELKRRVRSVLS
jgi:hypothetical protein